jgi:hypothetical protein
MFRSNLISITIFIISYLQTDMSIYLTLITSFINQLNLIVTYVTVLRELSCQFVSTRKTIIFACD